MFDGVSHAVLREKSVEYLHSFSVTSAIQLFLLLCKVGERSDGEEVWGKGRGGGERRGEERRGEERREEKRREEKRREEKRRGNCYSMKTTEGQLTKCVECIHRECTSVEKCD